MIKIISCCLLKYEKVLSLFFIIFPQLYQINQILICLMISFDDFESYCLQNKGNMLSLMLCFL